MPVFQLRCCALVAVLAGIARCVAGADNFPQVAVPVIPKTEVNLAYFGGVGDGAALNTDAFAKAISVLSAKGGGKLIVPPGIWLTGPIRLCSNLELHLERGAL